MRRLAVERAGHDPDLDRVGHPDAGAEDVGRRGRPEPGGELGERGVRGAGRRGGCSVGSAGMTAAAASRSAAMSSRIRSRSSSQNPSTSRPGK